MEMLKKLWRKKVLVVFLAATVLLLPSASVKPAQMLSKTLLVSIGINRADDGQYEVSGAMIVNKFTNTAESSTKVISESGKNLTQALNKISANQGRKVSLAHCNLIVLGSKLENDNISSIIGTFLRKFEMSNNALVVWTKDDPKKMQEISAENTTSASSGLLETVASYNQQEIFGKSTTVEEFYKDYLRPSSTSFIGTSSLQEETILNKTKLAVFKNGYYSAILESDETSAISLLKGESTEKSFVFSGVRGEQLENADIELQLLEKEKCIKTEFRNNKPHVKIVVKPKVKLVDLSERDDSERYLDMEESLPLDDVEDTFNNFILSNLISAVSRSSADILQIYDKFYREHNRKMKEYLQTKTIDDFLSDIVFDIDVKSTVVV